MDVMYQYIALGRNTHHVYVGVSGRYSRNCVDFLSGCTDKLLQAFTKQRVCIGTDQDQRSILFSLAAELHTALRVILNSLMENDASSGGQHPDGKRMAKSRRQATDDEAAWQYSLQDTAEPLDGDHLDVDNPRRQQHYESSTLTAKQLGLHLPDAPFSEKEPQRQSRFDGGIEDDDSKTKRTFVAVRQALADKRTAPTESSNGGQHPTGTQSSGECESGVRNSTIHPQLFLG